MGCHPEMKKVIAEEPASISREIRGHLSMISFSKLDSRVELILLNYPEWV